MGETQLFRAKNGPKNDRESQETCHSSVLHLKIGGFSKQLTIASPKAVFVCFFYVFLWFISYICTWGVLGL